MPKYGVVCCVWCAWCWFRLRLVFVLPRVTLRRRWFYVKWPRGVICRGVVCGMWYVVLVSCEAGIRYTSVGLSSTKVTVAHSPPVTEALPVDMDGDPHNLLQYKGVALVAFV